MHTESHVSKYEDANDRELGALTSTGSFSVNSSYFGIGLSSLSMAVPSVLFSLFAFGHALRRGSSSDLQPLQAIVLNTPGCGTHVLQETFQDMVRCDAPFQDWDTRGDGRHVLARCPHREESFVFRSDNVSDTVKFFQDHPKIKLGGENGRCVVATAFMNPLSWLKSTYLEEHAHELCNGTANISALLEDFDRQLGGIDASSFIAADVAGLFGLTDFPLLRKVPGRSGMYSLSADAHPQGVFASCQLVVVQVERMQSALPQLSRGLSLRAAGLRRPKSTQVQTKESCPEFPLLLSALEGHTLSSERKAKLCLVNRQLHALWDFYSPPSWLEMVSKSFYTSLYKGV